MSLAPHLAPVASELLEDIKDHNAIFHHLRIFHQEFPDLERVDVALVGLSENRGTIKNQGVSQATDDIRRKLYRLKRNAGPFRVVDLGNVRRGNTYEDSLANIKTVSSELMDKGILPVFFGGSHDLTYALFQAYQGKDKLVSVANVDATTDMAHIDEDSASENHIHQLFLHQPNYLFNYCLLGYQSYLADPVTVDMLHRLFFEAHRLGNLRMDFRQVEPLVREADMLSFDLSAVKSSDAPGNAYAQPFGFTGEEACQLCWYAGHSEKLSSLGLFDYNPELDDSDLKTASVVATMMWYVIEGVYHRKGDQHMRQNDYTRYSVDLGGDPDVLVFYKSRQSEKWWMEVPQRGDTGPYERKRIVPCSHEDYQMATKGEVPERYISTLNRLS